MFSHIIETLLCVFVLVISCPTFCDSEIEDKKNVTFNDTVLSYLQPKSFVFEPKMSEGFLENDTFTSVDIPLLVGVFFGSNIL